MSEYEKSLIEELQNITEDEVDICEILKSAKSSASQKELIKLMNSIRLPESTATPIDNVTRTFFSNDFSIDEEKDVFTGNDKLTKKPLYAFATISLQDVPDEIKLDATAVTDMDDLVFRAVCAFYDTHITRFTGQDIYRQMTGNNKAHASPEVLEEIHKSWKHLTNIQITLDTGDVGNGWKFERYRREEKIITGRTEQFFVTNQHGEFMTTVYSILGNPVLLEYANLLGHISRVSTKMLDTPMHKTPELLIIQTRLMDRIQAIKPPEDGKKKKMSNHILYASLFRNTEFSDATGTKRSRAIGYIADILNYWKNEGFIKNWHNIKRENKYYAIEIAR